jgi:hypothetical protein
LENLGVDGILTWIFKKQDERVRAGFMPLGTGKNGGLF